MLPLLNPLSLPLSMMISTEKWPISNLMVSEFAIDREALPGLCCQSRECALQDLTQSNCTTHRDACYDSLIAVVRFRLCHENHHDQHSVALSTLFSFFFSCSDFITLTRCFESSLFLHHDHRSRTRESLSFAAFFELHHSRWTQVSPFLIIWQLLVSADSLDIVGSSDIALPLTIVVHLWQWQLARNFVALSSSRYVLLAIPTAVTCTCCHSLHIVSSSDFIHAFHHCRHFLTVASCSKIGSPFQPSLLLVGTSDSSNSLFLPLAYHHQLFYIAHSFKKWHYWLFLLESAAYSFLWPASELASCLTLLILLTFSLLSPLLALSTMFFHSNQRLAHFAACLTLMILSTCHALPTCCSFSVCRALPT